MTTRNGAKPKPKFKIRIKGLEQKRAGDFKFNPLNWRVHGDAQRSALRTMLGDVGWVGAVLENKRTGNLIDGHARIEEAVADNPDQLVPYLVVDLSAAEEKAVLATLDPIGAMAEVDQEILDQLYLETLKGMPGLEDLLTSLHYDDNGASADELPDSEPKLDQAAELQKTWKIKRGQVWEIGAHRLMCGDSTSAPDVARLMRTDQATLLLTDPPYNVSVDYGDNVDDAKGDQEYETFARAWFGLWAARSDRQIVTPGCNNLARWTRYFEPYHVAPWTKSNSMTNGKIARWWCWEPIMFFGLNWPRARTNDLFDFPIGQQSGVANHPCPKPLKLWVELLEHYSEPQNIITDAFIGGGTSYVAAEHTGRACFGMELEPKFCAVTLERLATAFPELPIKKL